ncbi:HEAT repeat domain-containing protein [Gimesia fumaroli]|uniref:HEAT repeat protein n=1 Tax=Gimesia fumaroli TaxID=2527976 RepID=A0A518ILR4_9PLAN|nr:HEAT repeat domain-containing protein [Gimesia fumaroli]QDV54040.1 HEAT repeat protein [Gimesia fumaroli]
MYVLRETTIFCTLCVVLLLQGCGSADSPSVEKPIETSSIEHDSKITISEDVTITVPPEDPQREVKEVFQKLLTNRLEPDPDEWKKADKQLTAFGKTAVPTLTTEMSNSDPSARELASMYLASLGPEAKEAAPVLEQALQDESPFTQVNAASTLTHFPEYRDKAIPVLISLTKHTDANTRLTAIYALGSLESHEEAQLQAIKAALNDSDSDVQLAAIKVLGQIGDPAKETLTDLQTLIDNSETDEILREAALSSKSQIEQAKQ